MKLLLICAGGLSTGVLVKKLEQYAKEQGMDLSVSACGCSDYEVPASLSDVILVGPQIAYKEKEIEETCHKPCASISPRDYAMLECQTIVDQAMKLAS